MARTAHEVAVENAENHENDIANDDHQNEEDEHEAASEDEDDIDIAFNGLDINNNPIEVDINNNIPLVDENNNDYL